MQKNFNDLLVTVKVLKKIIYFLESVSSHYNEQVLEQINKSKEIKNIDELFYGMKKIDEIILSMNLEDIFSFKEDLAVIKKRLKQNALLFEGLAQTVDQIVYQLDFSKCD